MFSTLSVGFGFGFGFMGSCLCMCADLVGTVGSVCFVDGIFCGTVCGTVGLGVVPVGVLVCGCRGCKCVLFVIVFFSVCGC